MESANQRFGRFYAKVIRVTEGDLPANTQSVGHLIQGFHHHSRFGDSQQVNVLRVGFQFAGDVVRQVDDIVLIVAATAKQKLLALLEYAYHSILFRTDLDRIVHGRAKREEIVRHLRPDHADILILIVFKLRKKAAFSDGLRACLFKIRQRALQSYRGGSFATAADQNLLAKEIVRNFKKRDRHLYSRQLGKRHRIVIAQRLAHAFLARHPADVNARVVFADVHRARTE